MIAFLTYAYSTVWCTGPPAVYVKVPILEFKNNENDIRHI